MKKLAIILTLISLSSLAAQENYERDKELLLSNPKDSSIETKELDQYPEIHRFSDSFLQERNKRSGISSEAYYTRQDSSRFSLSYGFSYDYEELTKIQTVDFIYLNQFDNSYQEYWWGFQLKRTSAKYDAIAEERTSSSVDPNSVAATVRNDQIQLFNIIGFGIAHRFKTLSEALDSNRFFEMVSVFGNYNFHADSTDSESYSGFGYTAEYSLSYRSSKRFFYGGKISYNWALVDRPQVDEEDLTERSLVFGWTTVGFEFGYFF